MLLRGVPGESPKKVRDCTHLAIRGPEHGG